MGISASQSWIMAWLVAGAALAPACASAPSPARASAQEIIGPETDAERWKGTLVTQGGDPERVECRTQQVWDTDLRGAAKELAQETLAAMTASGIATTGLEKKALGDKVESMAMWALVRRLLLGGRHHNFGGFPLRGVKTQRGAPVIIYRTGVTATPNQEGSCVQSLLHYGQVRHIVNLYAGPMPTADLEVAERQAVQDVGGSYYLARKGKPEIAEWREKLREHGDSVREEVSGTIAGIINELILHPGGDAPLGNVHLHCGGGMHRTGMIMGIMDRCINDTERSWIEADYRRHVAWRSDENPGGFEAENLETIFSFDCSLIHAPKAEEPPTSSESHAGRLQAPTQ